MSVSSDTTNKQPDAGSEPEDPYQICLSIEVADARWDAAIGANVGLANAAIEALLAAVDTECTGEVSILLADDARLRKLNASFRDKDRPTNVLAFPDGSDVDGVCHIGDIALSLDRLSAEAEAGGVSLEHHFLHLLVHGVLHLLGYDHMTDVDAAEMEALEVEILADLGVDNPYGEEGK